MHYELKFQSEYATRRGVEFQRLFHDIMDRRFPGEFLRIKPWGKQGDLKCDGYARPIRTLFQVHAPQRMDPKEAIRKIQDDFEGALPHWRDHFDHWAYVHNQQDDLPPDVGIKILELHRDNNPPTVSAWGHSRILTEVRRLGASDLVAIFGYAPSIDAWQAMGYPEIQGILRRLETEPFLAPADLRPPPAEKVAINRLGLASEGLLRLGMTKSHHVGRLLASYPKPAFADEVAKKLTSNYQALKSSGISDPDILLIKLFESIGGGSPISPEHQVATWAVLAYFFERCDIFDREASSIRQEVSAT